MDPDELRRRIASFPRWHYEFDFGNGITTPIHDEDRGDRQHQRGRYFFDPLVAVAGGSLRGKRVLDLGCNAGWWSLRAAEAGADFVAGSTGGRCTSTRPPSCSRRRGSTRPGTRSRSATSSGTNGPTGPSTWCCVWACCTT